MSYALYKTASFGPGRAGLTTVGYTLTGGTRITAGVAEVGTSTGVYGAAVTFPDGFAGSVLWDTGQGGSTVYAAEDINPGPEYLDAKVSSRSTYAGGAVAGVTAPVTVGTVTDKTGYALSAAGLDAVTVDSGHNLRQVAALDHAVLCGTVSGQDANAPVFKAGGGSTTRVSAATDASGNRTSVTLAPPA